MAALADSWQNRISIDPLVCHGKPCIKGTRVLVEILVSYVASGETPQAVADAYPTIEVADVYAALYYAAEMTREAVIPIP